MTSLKRAIDEKKLGKFIAEHEGETGDADAFDATLRSMAGTSKAEPEASSQDRSDD
tara:strand:+ start:2151 stop:2318 length:168 start_codon:yes stop_codon:yes gene_type:complete